MNADKKHAGRGLEGARRAMAMSADEFPQGTASPRRAILVRPDPEVVATPTRQRFTAEDKLCILKLADACTAAGCLGPLLRDEGLYASHLTTWRRQRTAGVLSALTPQKRGRKASARHPLRAENEILRKEKARLTTRLKQAELIIDVQKKSHRSWASRWRCPRKAAHLMAATQPLSMEIGIKPAYPALFMTDGLRVSGRLAGEAGDFSAPVAVADDSSRAPRSLSGVIRWSSHVLSGRFMTHVSCQISLRYLPPRVRAWG